MMIIIKWRSIIFIAFLLLLLNGYYYYNYAGHQEYLGTRDVAKGIEGKAEITGTVSGFSADGFYLQIKYGTKRRIVEILSDADVKKGDVVGALGLISHGRMIPEKMVIKDEWSHRAVFILSAATVPFVAYLFFISWAFDPKARRFRKKDA